MNNTERILENRGHNSVDWQTHFSLLRWTFPRKNPLFWLLIGLWWGVMDSCLMKGYKMAQKLVWIAAKYSQTLKVVTRLCLLSIVSSHSTHRANNLFICKYSCQMWCTCSVEMFTTSPNLQTFNFWWPNIISWILSTISGVMASIRWPKRSPSLVLAWLQLNSINHFLIIDIDGAESS